MDLSKTKNVILQSVPGKEGFYKKLGFKKLTTAMGKFQNEQLLIEEYLANDE